MFYLASYLRSGYMGIMLLLLALYLLRPKQRPLVKDFMGISNGLLLVLIGINFGYWVFEVFNAWYGQNAYEQWAFSNDVLSLHYLAVSLLLECLLAILLCVKKWRATIWLSITACVCSTGFVTAFITGQLYQLFFRDYLPSSWSFEQPSFWQQWVDRLLPPVLFAATVLAFYWLRQRYRTYKQAG